MGIVPEDNIPGESTIPVVRPELPVITEDVRKRPAAAPTNLVDVRNTANVSTPSSGQMSTPGVGSDRNTCRESANTPAESKSDESHGIKRKRVSFTGHRKTESTCTTSSGRNARVNTQYRDYMIHVLVTDEAELIPRSQQSVAINAFAAVHQPNKSYYVSAPVAKAVADATRRTIADR